MLPPKLVRRLVVAPLVIVLALTLLLLSPLLLLLSLLLPSGTAAGAPCGWSGSPWCGR
ncbi:hypothetical protein ACFQX7_24100 [Luedemannella flava]